MNIMAMSTLGHHCYLGKEKNKLVRKVNIKEDLTLVGLLKDCAKHKDFHKGIALHDALFHSGLLEKNSYVSNTLIHMYVKCGNMEDARCVFEDFPDHDLVMWSTLLAGYARHGRGQEGLELFYEMLEEGVDTNRGSLSGCGNVHVHDKSLC